MDDALEKWWSCLNLFSCSSDGCFWGDCWVMKTLMVMIWKTSLIFMHSKIGVFLENLEITTLLKLSGEKKKITLMRLFFIQRTSIRSIIQSATKLWNLKKKKIVHLLRYIYEKCISCIFFVKKVHNLTNIQETSTKCDKAPDHPWTSIDRPFLRLHIFVSLLEVTKAPKICSLAISRSVENISPSRENLSQPHAPLPESWCYGFMNAFIRATLHFRIWFHFTRHCEILDVMFFLSFYAGAFCCGICVRWIGAVNF